MPRRKNVTEVTIDQNSPTHTEANSSTSTFTRPGNKIRWIAVLLFVTIAVFFYSSSSDTPEIGSEAEAFADLSLGTSLTQEPQVNHDTKSSNRLISPSVTSSSLTNENNSSLLATPPGRISVNSDEKYSIILPHYSFVRRHMIPYYLSCYVQFARLDRVFVVWENATAPLPDIPLDWPVTFILPSSNGFNNMFRPIESLKTDAVIVVHDDVLLYEEGAEFLFHTWLKYPDRLIGPVERARSHLNTNFTFDYHFQKRAVDQVYSMVLTCNVIFHRKYLEMYSGPSMQWIRQQVQQMRNGEDIAMNLLIANATGLPPIALAKHEDGVRTVCFGDLSASKFSTSNSNLGMHVAVRSQLLYRFITYFKTGERSTRILPMSILTKGIRAWPNMRNVKMIKTGVFSRPLIDMPSEDSPSPYPLYNADTVLHCNPHYPDDTCTCNPLEVQYTGHRRSCGYRTWRWLPLPNALKCVANACNTTYYYADLFGNASAGIPATQFSSIRGHSSGGMKCVHLEAERFANVSVDTILTSPSPSPSPSLSPSQKLQQEIQPATAITASSTAATTSDTDTAVATHASRTVSIQSETETTNTQPTEGNESNESNESNDNNDNNHSNDNNDNNDDSLDYLVDHEELLFMGLSPKQREQIEAEDQKALDRIRSSCVPQASNDTQLFFYNRVPKCGSSSLQSIIHQLESFSGGSVGGSRSRGRYGPISRAANRRGSVAAPFVYNTHTKNRVHQRAKDEFQERTWWLRVEVEVATVEEHAINALNESIKEQVDDPYRREQVGRQRSRPSRRERRRRMSRSRDNIDHDDNNINHNESASIRIPPLVWDQHIRYLDYHVLQDDERVEQEDPMAYAATAYDAHDNLDTTTATSPTTTASPVTTTSIAGDYHPQRLVTPDGISFAYFNLLRNPVNRVVSDYYYMVSTPARNKILVNAELRKRGLQGTFDVNQCLALEPSERTCYFYPNTDYNLMTAFFCGHASVCRCVGSEINPEDNQKNCTAGGEREAALRLAKQHLVQDYLIVGITEQYRDSLTMFSHLLPQIFGSVQRISIPRKRQTTYFPSSSAAPKPATKLGEGPVHSKINQESTLKLEKILAIDVRFYRFARKVFSAKKQGLRSKGSCEI